LKLFAPAALDRDRTDKRGALVLITAMLAVIFGAFALFDPEVAPAMLSIGAVVLLLVGGAYLLSGRIARRHLSFRSGEVIVGRDGLLVNGVLHVWSVPLSWLVGATLDPGAMTVTYAHFIRYGVQTVDVLLPVPHGAQEDAQKAVLALQTR
jgi:uncharacterized membrane protein HdeD (DUF308 family)